VYLLASIPSFQNVVFSNPIIYWSFVWYQHYLALPLPMGHLIRLRT